MSDVILSREEYNALVADRDRARAIAVHLESENARLLQAVKQIQATIIDAALLTAEAIVKGEVHE